MPKPGDHVYVTGFDDSVHLVEEGPTSIYRFKIFCEKNRFSGAWESHTVKPVSCLGCIAGTELP